MPMNNVCFKTDLFTSQKTRSRSEMALDHFLDCLYKLDCDYLRAKPQTPFILNAGVRYRAESYNKPESWKTIPLVMRDGFGDCEDLACWLAAALTVQRGNVSRPLWKVKRRGNFSLYHIQVRDSHGRILDPSKALGMR